MFKTYLTLAIRNLWKRKATTTINVLGLSLGLACCALVSLFFKSELRFDKNFDHSGNIYRITSSFSDGSFGPTVTMSYAKYLKAEIPEIEEVSRLNATNATCVVESNQGGQSRPYMVQSGYWVDPSFFKIFSFHFLQGNRFAAFNAPNTIVLSKALAQRIYGNILCIGKTVRSGPNTYTVSGVINDDIPNHIQADFFASNNSNIIRDAIASKTNWAIDPNYYTYVKLKQGSSIQHVIAELNAYTQSHAAADLKATATHVINSLQPLTDIHLRSFDFVDALAYKQGNIRYLYLLSGIALAILLLGCINYMNLSTAQSIDRSREVGVRRVLGAEKWSIRCQFLLETTLMSVLALFIACVLAWSFLPSFNNLINQHLSFFTFSNIAVFGWLLLITLCTGLLAGLYPAFYLSSFSPAKVLKSRPKDSVLIFGIRKILVSGQFIISTFLVFATLVIWDQLHFMIHTNTGFDQQQQLVIGLNSYQEQKNCKYLINQLSGNTNFQSVTGATAPLSSGDMEFYLPEKGITEKHDVFLNYVDNNYLKTLNLKLIAGTNFSPVSFSNIDVTTDMETTDMGREVILNEEAVKALGLSPETAPGKYLAHLHNGRINEYRIVGVVKNYHYFSLHAALGPCGIIPANPLRFSTVIAKLRAPDARAGIQFATQLWRKTDPDSPFTYSFLDNVFRNDYVIDQHERKLISTFASIAILISCMGLLGLITYSLSQKVREIAVRKVIGASVNNIVVLFYSQYLKIIVIANIIALPLAWYFMNSWLADFPYHISISWWMFLTPVLMGALVAFFTIIFKTIKAANANPVDGLRAE
ncbi:MAG TPA: ABC transporter permease [Mucilaginibacter sp.]|jgi:putative ABC transport system permease protein